MEILVFNLLSGRIFAFCLTGTTRYTRQGTRSSSGMR